MIQVTPEQTPNPATLKFVASVQLSPAPYEFATAQDTDGSPLAAKIFGFPWTSSIFINDNFITVTKQDWVEWEILAEPLAGLIREHLEAGEPVIVHIPKEDLEDSANDSTVVKQIKTILNREIRPAVALDGGDILFAKYEDNVVYLRMKGACAGCPSSTATLKEGVEVRLKQSIPEIREVVSI